MVPINKHYASCYFSIRDNQQGATTMEQAFEISSQANNQLINFGFVLFFLGLLQGLTIALSKNKRMALSAHLTATQSGVVLIVCGICAPLLSLSAELQQYCSLAIIAGAFILWLGITAAAITGASRALPMAGEGFNTKSIIEVSVTGIVYLGSLLQLFGFGLYLWGLLG